MGGLTWERVKDGPWTDYRSGHWSLGQGHSPDPTAWTVLWRGRFVADCRTLKEAKAVAAAVGERDPFEV